MSFKIVDIGMGTGKDQSISLYDLSSSDAISAACILIILVTTGNGNIKMATSVDDESKKLQVSKKLQKREEERLHNIQQRKIVKGDESVVHVRWLQCCLLQLLVTCS